MGFALGSLTPESALMTICCAVCQSEEMTRTTNILSLTSLKRERCLHFNKKTRAFLVAQWERILPPKQERHQPLIQEDPTCHRAAKPMHYNYLACALELSAMTTEAREPRVCALHQEKPPQWEACEPQPESRPHLLQLERGPHSSKDSAQPKMNK